MRVLWLSNSPWSATGYGEQTALFAPRIAAAGHDVAIFANWGLTGGGGEWNGLRVYPADGQWGNRDLKAFAAHHGDGDDCLTLSLCDVFVLSAEKMPERMASWVPVDHDPMPPAVRQFFAATGSRPIAMSRFGARELERCGFDPLYVPHGIDTTLFRPFGEADRLAARDEIGIPADAFVVGMVAANKSGQFLSRKAFPQVFQAFAEFRERHRDALLYVHTDIFGADSGINLRALQHACGMPARSVMYTDQLVWRLGPSRESLAAIYNLFDVLANPSFGEGFGVPIVEAQACGVPVIVTDWTAMPELCGAGWLVDGDRWYNGAQGSFYKCPALGEIVEAFEAAYDRAASKRDEARAFAELYDADRVFREFWTPALEALEARDLEAVAA